MSNPALRSSSVNQGTGGNVVGNLPAGTVDGDLLVAGVFINHASSTPGISAAPAGWTLIDGQTTGVGISNNYGLLNVYWKIAAGEPSTWTWTGTGAGAGYSYIVEVFAVSNPSDTVAPFDGHQMTTSSSVTNSIVAYGVTTTRPSDLLLGFFGVHSNTTITPDASMTEVQDKGVSAGTLEAAWSILPAPGASNSMVAVSGSSDYTIAWLGAVKAVPQPTGAPAVRSSSSTPNQAISALTGTLPPGTVNGDALYACVFTNGSSTNPTITGVPAGWTLIDTAQAPNTRMSVYWKIAASEPSTWTWQASASVNSCVIQVVAVQNPGNPTTPTDVSAIQPNASSVNVAASSITPTGLNDLVIGFFGVHNATSFTSDAAMNELQDQSSSGLATLETAWETRPSLAATGTRTAVAALAGPNIGWLGAVYGASPSPRTGTLTATLGNVTVASAAGAVAGGTLSRTLASVTVASAATAIAGASLSKTLDLVTLASAMQVGRVGLLTQMLGDVTVASAVEAVAGATLSRTLGNVTVASAVQVLANGQLARTLDNVTFSGVGGQVARATLTATLGNASLFSAVGVSAGATANNVLAPVTLSSAATLVSGSTLTQTLEDVAFNAFASFPPIIGLSEVLEDVTLVGVGSVRTFAFVNQFLGNVTLVGAATTPVIASLSRALDPTSVTGLGAQVNHYTLTQTLLDATLVGIGSAYTPSSARTGSMYALLDPVVTTTASTATITGRMNQTLDDITITDVIDVLANAVGILSLNPALLLALVSAPSIGTLDVTLNDSLLFSNGNVPITNGLVAVLDNVTFVGTARAPITCRCTATLSDISATLQVDVPIICRCTAILGDLVLGSSSSAYTVARVSATLGNVRLTSQVIAAAIGVLDSALEDVALQGGITIPALVTLTAALGTLAFSGAANAYATGRMTSTLDNVTGNLQAGTPATATAVPILEGLTLAASAGAIIEGRHTTLLDDVVLGAVGNTVTNLSLIQVLDDMQMVGYALHVVRTPILHVDVKPNYVYALVSTSEIHVEVETTFIEAMLTKDYMDRAA